MKRIIAIILLIGSTVFNTVAHNAKIATFTLRDTGAGWLVEMNFAQAGVDATMIEIHGSEKLENLDKKSYQNLIVEYVKSNFNLKVDGEVIKLKNGGIMLGSHQTDLKFVLPEMPPHPGEAQIYIPMFGNTYNHTNLFRIYRGGKNITKFFLSEDNGFNVDLNFTPIGIVAVEKEPRADQFFMLSGGGLMLAIVMVIAFSRKKLKA
ncbi:hypothetical protein [Reichenbachiella sp.]|uniref:hypothetical protein n=1 Tax=Reichenbachiella sp. TaxID=2184521 RepID=UPI003BAF880C